MNRIEGNIKSKEDSNGLCKITLQSGNVLLHAILLEDQSNDFYLKQDSKVAFLFKETNVILGLSKTYNISFDNVFHATIKSINKGKLLTQIYLAKDSLKLSAVISTEKTNVLNLKSDTEVSVMINMSDILITSC